MFSCSINCSHILTKYSHIQTIYSHIPTKCFHILTNSSHILTNCSHILTRYSHILTKCSHILTKMFTYCNKILPYSNKMRKFEMNSVICVRTYHISGQCHQDKYYIYVLHILSCSCIVLLFCYNPVPENPLQNTGRVHTRSHPVPRIQEYILDRSTF